MNSNFKKLGGKSLHFSNPSVTSEDEEGIKVSDENEISTSLKAFLNSFKLSMNFIGGDFDVKESEDENELLYDVDNLVIIGVRSYMQGKDYLSIDLEEDNIIMLNGREVNWRQQPIDLRPGALIDIDGPGIEATLVSGEDSPAIYFSEIGTAVQAAANYEVEKADAGSSTQMTFDFTGLENAWNIPEAKEALTSIVPGNIIFSRSCNCALCEAHFSKIDDQPKAQEVMVTSATPTSNVASGGPTDWIGQVQQTQMIYGSKADSQQWTQSYKEVPGYPVGFLMSSGGSEAALAMMAAYVDNMTQLEGYAGMIGNYDSAEQAPE